MDKIEETLEFIASSISKCKLNNIGLLSGLSGLALFELAYGTFYNKKYISVGLSFIEKVFTLINKQTQANFCAGISGVAWTLNYIKNKNWNYIANIDSTLDILDKYIYMHISHYLKANYFDFLYGYIGIGHYLVERISSNPQASKIIDLIINKLKETAIHKDGKIKWLSRAPNFQSDIINISLSHGMSSIIIFLSNIYQLKHRQECILPLIKGAVKYIISQEINYQLYNSFFPSLSLESSHKLTGSRLGWCYGDLGICFALLKAGNVTNNPIWQNKALTILEYEANNRRELKSSLVYDACFCHGSIGIAHIYFRLWFITQKICFKQAADYWYTISMNINKKSNSASAGYSFFLNESIKTSEDYSILNGISGIGLSLLFYKKSMPPDFDKCLMLS